LTFAAAAVVNNEIGECVDGLAGGVDGLWECPLGAADLRSGARAGQAKAADEYVSECTLVHERAAESANARMGRFWRPAVSRDVE
jgi:hypothetical protein